MSIQVEENDSLTTYRYLRMTMPVLVVMLGAAIVYQIFAPTIDDCWLGSISAYYYTSARAVFVACLCAIGACLIAYRGNTKREDLVLNIAGALLFVVAFIPTPLGEVDTATEAPTCGRSNVPTEQQLVAALNNNIVALLVGATIAAGLVFVLRWARDSSDDPNRPLPITPFLTAGVVLVAWILFAVAPDEVRDRGHIVAAVIVFAGIVAVVAMQSFSLSWLDPAAVTPREPYLTTYRIILVLMLAVVAVFGLLALADTFDHAVFWLESGVIVLFGIYWVVQTKELWKGTDRASVHQLPAQ